MLSFGLDISNGPKCLRTNWLQINERREARKLRWNSNHGETIITARSLASLFVINSLKAACFHSIQRDDKLIQGSLLAFHSDRRQINPKQSACISFR